jgi:hypothetical protein
LWDGLILTHENLLKNCEQKKRIYLQVWGSFRVPF